MGATDRPTATKRFAELAAGDEMLWVGAEGDAATVVEVARRCGRGILIRYAGAESSPQPGEVFTSWLTWADNALVNVYADDDPEPRTLVRFDVVAGPDLAVVEVPGRSVWLALVEVDDDGTRRPLAWFPQAAAAVAAAIHRAGYADGAWTTVTPEARRPFDQWTDGTVILPVVDDETPTGNEDVPVTDGAGSTVEVDDLVTVPKWPGQTYRVRHTDTDRDGTQWVFIVGTGPGSFAELQELAAHVRATRPPPPAGSDGRI